VPPRAAIAAVVCALIGGCSAAAAPASDPLEPALSAGAPSPTPYATLPPLVSPQPVHTLAPAAGTLALEATTCDGGVVLEWSPSADPDFHHYTALRSADPDVAPQYPPIAPAVDWGGTFATDRFVVSAVDASILPSDTEWSYRVMSYDAENRVLGASPVVTARMRAVADLGALRAERAGPRGTRLEWEPYAGRAECFTEYRILHATAGPPSTLVATVSGQDAVSFETDAFRGATHTVQVEAVRTTALGSFVVARSDVLSVGG
jgi:hypothetical protein